MKIRPKRELDIEGKRHPAGKEITVKDSLGSRLISVGLAESAMMEPAENAMKSKPEAKYLGGGWYQCPDGRKVRGRANG